MFLTVSTGPNPEPGHKKYWLDGRLGAALPPVQRGSEAAEGATEEPQPSWSS